VLYTPALWCDVNDSLSVISLYTGETSHDSHDLMANTRDAETAKSCGSCARALWSNVRGSIEIASSSGSVSFQTGRTKFTYLRRAYARICLGDTHMGCTVDQLSLLLRRRDLRIDTWTASLSLVSLVGWLVGTVNPRTVSFTGTAWLVGPRCILKMSVQWKYRFWFKGKNLSTASDTSLLDFA
jgi:hypothetical protein